MAVASAVDFITSNVSSGSVLCQSSDKGGMKMALLLSYTVIAWGAMSVWENVTDPGFCGFCLFLGSAIQLLAYVSLALKVMGTKSVEGLSSQSLMLVFTSLFFRLICTTTYQGYLPADESGDYLYQLLDFCTLLVVVYLLFSAHKTYVHTYQEDHDTLNTLPMLASSAVLAIFIHGNLNDCPIFDKLWAFSLNVEVCQMLPQVYMLAKVGGLVDKTTAHFVANIFLSCICRCVFWAWAIDGCADLSGREELTSLDGYSWSIFKEFPQFTIGGWHIFLAHILQLLILIDFMYYYAKWWRSGGKTMTLPQLDTESL